MAVEEKIIIEVEVRKDQINIGSKNIELLQKEIQELRDQQKRYKNELKTGAITQDQYNELVIATKNQIQTLNKNLREETKTLALNNQVVNSAEGSYEQLTAELRLQKLAWKKLSDEHRENTKEGKELEQNIANINSKLKQIDSNIKIYGRNVGNYGSVWQGVQSGILKVTGIIAGASGIINAISKLNDIVEKTNKIQDQLRFSFKVTGDELKDLTVLVKNIGDNFDLDYNEVIKTANAVSKEFGITANKALELIDESAKKGANSTGELLDIAREYSTQLQSVGLNAEESFAIITQQVQEGIYSDKGIDAIKEAGLRLRENNQSLKDALAPLDDAIELQIRQQVEAGNVFEAIQLISKELKNTNLTAEQTQRIISDVFGGAGEDAGLRYLQLLGDVNLELSQVEEKTSDLTKANQNLTEATNKLTVSLTTSDGILSRFFANIKQGLADSANSLVALNELGEETGSTFENIVSGSLLLLNTLQPGLIEFREGVKSNFLGAFDLIDNITDESFSNIKNKLNSLLGDLNAVRESQKKANKQDKEATKKEQEQFLAEQEIIRQQQLAKDEQFREIKSIGFEETIGNITQLRIQFDEQNAQLDEQRLNSLQSRLTNFMQKYLEIQKNLTIKNRLEIASATANILDQTASLFKENTIAYKILASARTAIDSYRAAVSALAETPGGPILKGIAFASTLATGLAAVAKINGIQFDRGGILKGLSHAQGGINLYSKGGQFYGNAEGGEAIINARSTAMFTPELSAINSYKGYGKPLMQAGGITNNNFVTNRIVNQAIRGFPQKQIITQPVLIKRDLDEITNDQVTEVEIETN